MGKYLVQKQYECVIEDYIYADSEEEAIDISKDLMQPINMFDWQYLGTDVISETNPEPYNEREIIDYLKACRTNVELEYVKLYINLDLYFENGSFFKNEEIALNVTSIYCNSQDELKILCEDGEIRSFDDLTDEYKHIVYNQLFITNGSFNSK